MKTDNKLLDGFVKKWPFIEKNWNGGKELSTYNRSFFLDIFKKIQEQNKEKDLFKNHSLSPREQQLLINKLGLSKNKPTA